jgi:hypothetical protein
MNFLLKMNLVVLVLLATSSGVSKIMLIPQEVAFFGLYGFTDPILITYGTTSFIGGIMLIIRKTRLFGAVIVAITFLISAVVLILAGNVPFTIFTFVSLLMLAVLIKQNMKKIESTPA